VRDGREVLVAGRPLCRPCATGAYFQHPREISWPEMEWSPCAGQSRQQEPDSAGSGKLKDPPRPEEVRRA